MFKAIASSLQIKIVFAAVIVLGVPIAILVGYNTLDGRQHLLEDETANEVAIIDGDVQAVSDSLALLEANTLFLANAPATERYANYLAGADDPEAQPFAEDLYLAYLDNNTVPIYDIRVIDTSGQEVLRVDDSEGGSARVVSGAELENKATRDWFINSINLPTGQIYNSGFDLATTGDEYEVPYLPIIRFVVPLDSSSGERVGIIVMKIPMAAYFEELAPDDAEEP